MEESIGGGRTNAETSPHAVERKISGKSREENHNDVFNRLSVQAKLMLLQERLRYNI